MKRPKSLGQTAVVSGIMLLGVLAFILPVQNVSAQPTTITAYKSQYAVNVKSAYQPSQWTDTPTINVAAAGMTFAAKQNGTGWLFLMTWQQSKVYCTDEYCFGGIELGYLNNTQPMGSSATATMMILASTSFKNGVDEFVSTGAVTPESVESLSYTTQSVCGLTLTSGQYTVECYRPFKLANASPYDFRTLGVGSTIEIGFAVGEFSSPGDHLATDMSTYVLAFSGQTYPSGTSTSTTSSSTTTTSSTTSSTHSTTSTTTTLSSSSTTKSSSSSSSTSTGTATTAPAYAVAVATNSNSYTGSASGTISGTVTPAPPAGSTVTLGIVNPLNTSVFTATASVSASGSFSATFTPSPAWGIPGRYTLTATYYAVINGTGPAFFTATYRIAYIPYVVMTVTTFATTTVTLPGATSTITMTKTATATATGSATTTAVSGPVTTVSGPVITVSGPVTTVSGSTTIASVTSTLTTTASGTTVPAWAYGALVALLLIGLATGYAIRRPQAHPS